jgi:hypothetical protein
MARKVVLASALLLSAMVAIAQQSGVGSLGRPEWEYLVISFGKAYFGEPQKSSRYGPITHQSWQEATAIQLSLDGLGRLGWELVAVVGAIGGDQELILKRRSDPTLLKKETDFLAKENAAAVTEMTRKYQKGAEIAAKNAKLAADKKMLADLDSIEAQQDVLQRQQEADTYIKELTDGITARELVKKNRSLVGLTYTVTLQYDLTEDYLKNTNEYRKSSVDTYLSERSEEIGVNSDLLWIYDIELVLEACLRFNGKLEKVSDMTTRYGLSTRLGTNE